MRTASLCLPATLATLKVGDREEPKVQPGLVKVRWRASTLNFHDYVVVTGGLPSADGRIPMSDGAGEVVAVGDGVTQRSEEHTSELQSLMRISYAVFCLK